MDQNVIKTKNEELSLIAKELKKHFYVGEFFVDPDKKFLNLLEKIIVNKHIFKF